MPLDIAPALPPAPQSAPPGTGQTPPAEPALLFAALLAQQALQKASAKPPAGQPPQDNSIGPKPDTAKTSKDGAKDADPNTQISLLIPIAVPPMPPPALSAPPPISAGDAAKSAPKNAEAMDTSLFPAPALSGAVAANTGGELLPQQTTQSAKAVRAGLPPLFAPPADPSAVAGLSPAAAPAAAVSVPAAAPAAAVPASSTTTGAPLLPASAAVVPAQADAQAPGQSVPAPTAAQQPQSALAILTLHEQAALQNKALPANNTGIEGAAPATPAEADAALSLLPSVSGRAPSLPASLASQAVETGPDKEKAAKSDIDASLLSVLPQAARSDGASAAPAQPASLTPTDRSALMQQVSDGMQAMRLKTAANGQGQITLSLHPHDWGKLQVLVSMTPGAAADGGTLVTAHLTADNPAVKSALENHSSELRRTLHEAGLSLERMSVTVRSVQAGSAGQSMTGDPGHAGRGSGQSGADAWEQSAQSSVSNGASSFGSAGQGAGAQPGSGQDAGEQARQRAFFPRQAQMQPTEGSDDTASPAPTMRGAIQKVDTRA